MKFLSTLWGVTILAATMCAADIVTKSGEVFKNYQILGGNEVRIVVSHDGGDSVVLVEDWPDDRRDELPGQKPEEEAAPEPEPEPVVEFKVPPRILTMADGREYREYQISGTSADGVVVIHESGMATIPVEEWPQDKLQEIVPYLEEIQSLKKEQEAAKEKEEEVLLARYAGRFAKSTNGRVYDLGAGAPSVPGQAVPVTGILEKSGTGAVVKVPVEGYSSGDAMTPAQRVQYTVSIRIEKADFPKEMYGKNTTVGVLLLQQTGAAEYQAEQLKPLEQEELLQFLRQYRIGR